MKRAFDFVVSLIALVVLSPLLLAIAVAIKATSRGPVLYRGVRVGRHGVPFEILKFRTMRAGSPGPAITAAGDSRITRVGRLLRRAKLDEIPQLVNVLRGEMSLVGPRPEAEPYVRLYTDEERRVLAVRPGITSLVSLRYRDEESLLAGDAWEKHYVDVIMRDKLRGELEYLRSRTFRSDLGVLMRTLGALFSLRRPPRGLQ